MNITLLISLENKTDESPKTTTCNQVLEMYPISPCPTYFQPSVQKYLGKYQTLSLPNVPPAKCQEVFHCLPAPCIGVTVKLLAIQRQMQTWQRISPNPIPLVTCGTKIRTPSNYNVICFDRVSRARTGTEGIQHCKHTTYFFL